MSTQTQKHEKANIEIAGTDLLFRTVSLNDESPSGGQLAHAAGFSATQYVCVLQLRNDKQLEDVRTVESVSLVDGRRFIIAESDRSYRLAMDGETLDWPNRFITAATIRKLAGVPNDKAVYLEHADTANRLLAEDEIVDLAEPGVERFRRGTGNHPKEQTVHVKHLGELESASFKVAEAMTLQAIWDRAYQEIEVARDPRDVFQSEVQGQPVNLMDYLELSLIEAQSRELCMKKFEIAPRTGGA